MNASMIRFDPADPYPLLVADPDYALAREHSAMVDDWLGLRIESIEAGIARAAREQGAWVGHQAWVNLPAQTLLTPYTEVRRMLDVVSPRPGETVVDLGAGYGRMGFVLDAHYRDVRFVGYELVQARVDEGRRCLRAQGYLDSGLIQADLSDPAFAPCEAEYYFIYDFGTRAAIAKALDDLKQIAQRRRITVIGRGRASRDAIERDQPWLSQVISPVHFAHYSIYSSA